jgi:beta-galactosidase
MISIRFFTVVLLCVSLPGFAAQDKAASSPVTIDATAPIPPPRPAAFHAGTAVNPSGETIGINDRYLMLNGKPWLPVMGEFHYTRVPEEQWEEQILKMKAAGVQIVATYVIWIHHEEVEGQFDWSGRRNLRHFVELCARHGMYVYPRIGPWAHGEVRNGGFPDWIVQKVKNTRRNDPLYLSYVETWYAQIAEQLHGLLWKDGGPVIGIQLENEYSMQGPDAGEAHILTLKRMAVSSGLDAPLYSVTGWDTTAIPKDEVVTVFGGYPDAPWDSSLQDLPPQEVYAFHFDRGPSGNMGAIGPVVNDHAKNAPSSFPFMTAEMGGGVQDTYLRRPVIQPDDVAAMVPARLGSGVNLYGTYMFQGGENPDGRLTTLQESQATGYATDVPVKSYDFQAPLGEFGEERALLRKLKIFNYFLNDFGGVLAPMLPFAPAKLSAGPEDLSIPRVAVRTDGKSGFLFFNNYLRHYAMPDRPAFQATIKLPGRTLKLPAQPVDMPSGSYGIWPFGLTLGGFHLRYAIAQLFTRIADPSGISYYFVATRGVLPEFVFEDVGGVTIAAPGSTLTRQDGSIVITNLHAALDQAITATQEHGGTTRIALLTEEQAENLWKLKTGNVDRLLLTPDQFYANKTRATLQRDGDPNFRFTVIPPLVKPPTAQIQLKTTGAGQNLSAFTGSLPKRAPRVSVEALRPAGSVPPVKLSPPLSWRPVGIAVAPDEEAFALAAKWIITIPPQDWEGVDDLFLEVNYDGDVARLTSGGRLLVDNFYNGGPWRIGLKRFRSQIAGQGLVLEILPRRADAPVFLEKPYRDASPKAGQIVELHSLELVPQYELQLDFMPDE